MRPLYFRMKLGASPSVCPPSLRCVLECPASKHNLSPLTALATFQIYGHCSGPWPNQATALATGQPQIFDHCTGALATGHISGHCSGHWPQSSGHTALSVYWPDLWPLCSRYVFERRAQILFEPLSVYKLNRSRIPQSHTRSHDRARPRSASI